MSLSTGSSVAASSWASPQNLLRVSVVVALLTIGLKTMAWQLTGSVGLLSDALESFVNLAGALFALRMVTVAQRPADEGHPFGHNKAEYFSSGFEGILIAGTALGIAWASIERLLNPQPLEQLGWGMGLSLVGTALNGGLAWLMFRSAQRYRSEALRGDARHLLADVWTTAGVLLGLLGAALSGWMWLDAAVALLVAVKILYEGVQLVWQASQGLMDEALETEVQLVIHDTLNHWVQQAVNEAGLPAPALGGKPAIYCDHVATRRAGQRSYVDLHLHLPADWPLGRAARLRYAMEQALMQAVPGLRATIELLPTGQATVFEQEGGLG